MKNKEELIKLFHIGMLDEKDTQVLEEMVINGEVDIEELEAFNLFSADIDDQNASAQFNDQAIYGHIHDRNAKSDRKSSWLSLIPMPIKWGFPVLLVAFGYMMGNFNPSSEDAGIKISTEQGETTSVMASVVGRESTGSRMATINDLNKTVTSEDAAIKILFMYLNNDRSDHVRMTAIDELIRYSDNEGVREELIRSISLQHSPLVLQHLSEALKIIGEKISIDTYKELMSKEIPESLRSDLEKNLHTI